MKNYLLVLMLALQIPSTWGTEVDNFTDRDKPLTDSREVLNTKMNNLILESLQKTNRKYNCETEALKANEYFYSELNDEIGGYFWAKYENEVMADPTIDKRYFKRKDSIYNGLNAADGFAFKLAKLGAIVNIGNNLVGTDKLGHFIGIGKVYFDKMRKQKKTLKEVLEHGDKLEAGYFGKVTTGIYSYGDVVSNYEGLLFWQNMFSVENSYISCSGGEMVQIRAFDWLEYVNDAWDESINCSDYRNKKIKVKVFAEIERRTQFKGCPIIPLQPSTKLRYLNLPIKVLN